MLDNRGLADDDLTVALEVIILVPITGSRATAAYDNAAGPYPFEQVSWGVRK